jgi:hypothetical protein
MVGQILSTGLFKYFLSSRLQNEHAQARWGVQRFAARSLDDIGTDDVFYYSELRRTPSKNTIFRKNLLKRRHHAQNNRRDLLPLPAAQEKQPTMEMECVLLLHLHRKKAPWQKAYQLRIVARFALRCRMMQEARLSS